MAQTVAVIGGTGFLGRRVTSAARRHGLSTLVVARRGPSDVTAADGFATADVTDPAALAQALEGVDAVVNCVALYVETGGATFQGVHVDGARNVARATAEAGAVALVHVSGIGANAAADSPYVRARGQGEAAVREAFPGATVLRPSVMFGEGDDISGTIAKIAAVTPLIPLFGSGGTRLQPVWVDDVAEAACRALQTPAAKGADFELGGPEVLTYRQLIECVLEWTGRRRLLMPFPWIGWSAMASAGRLLPSSPVTEGQVALMRRDNLPSPGSLGFADLGIVPTRMDSIVPACLSG